MLGLGFWERSRERDAGVSRERERCGRLLFLIAAREKQAGETREHGGVDTTRSSFWPEEEERKEKVILQKTPWVSRKLQNQCKQAPGSCFWTVLRLFKLQRSPWTV